MEKTTTKKITKKVTRPVVIILAAILLLSAIGCSGGNPAGSSQNGAQSGQTGQAGATWKVGIFDLDLPPLFFEDADGNLTGFEIDLVTEVAGRIGKEIEYVRVDDKYAEALESGEVDVVWGNIADTEELRSTLLLTEPYLQTDQVAVVAVDSGIETKSDLDGKEYFTVRWTPADLFVKNRTFDIVGNKITATRNFQSVFNSFKEKQDNVVICDVTLANYMMEESGGGFNILTEVLGQVNYAAVFRPDDTETCAKVQSALDAIAANGTGEKLSQQWFGKDLFIN